MHRILVGVAVVAVVLAVGAVVLVALHSTEEPETTPKPPETTEVAEPGAPIVLTETPARKARRVATKDEAKAGEKDKVAAAAGGAPEVAAGEGTDGKVNRILADLNNEEQQALMRAMGRRMGEQRREQQRYDLPSDRRLRRLERSRDETLRLSDAQREQIEAVRSVMKPKIEAAMQGIWAKQEELQGQVSQLREEGKRDEIRAVFEQYGPLREQANELQAPLDEEYKTSLSAILSPEQTQALEQQGGGESRDRGGRRRGGIGGGNPGAR